MLFESEETDYSLADLGRAIASAQRRDNVPVWRAFVRMHGEQLVREVKTFVSRIKRETSVSRKKDWGAALVTLHPKTSQTVRPQDRSIPYDS